MFTGLGKAIRETMSEPGANGTLSWGRVVSSLTVITGIVWGSFLVFKSQPHALPPLSDLIAFMLAPYGTNKAITAVQSFGSNPVNK